VTHQGNPDRSLLSRLELSTVNVDRLSMSEDQMMGDPIEGTNSWGKDLSRRNFEETSV
jgi:hypothetical protein